MLIYQKLSTFSGAVQLGPAASSWIWRMAQHVLGAAQPNPGNAVGYIKTLANKAYPNLKAATVFRVYLLGCFYAGASSEFYACLCTDLARGRH